MANIRSIFIRNMRVQKGYSQEMVAKDLGISRASYINIESGKRQLELEEAGNLARMFEISIEELLRGKVDAKEKISLRNESSEKTPKQSRDEERISVPQEKVDKFKQVLLYILSKVGGKPNIGQTVLYKLLYFIDFDYYEKYEEQLIGARYIKNTHGPTPVIFSKITENLESHGKIEAIKSKFYKYDQTKYLINPELKLDLSSLSAQELAHIDWELERLSDMTAKKISDLSHKDTPWRIANDKEVLNYNYVFYRPEETSVREYEPL